MEHREQLRTMARRAFDESVRVKNALCGSGLDVLLRMADTIAETFRGRGRLFLFGNGGSAADAQHLAAEFVNRFGRERPPLPALALTVDTSVITSIGNDSSFNDIFSRQLEALAQPGDAALGISTSGRSANVLKALEWARSHELHTLGWSGEEITAMDDWCDLILHVPSRITARIQESHLTAGHVLCELVEEILFGGIGE